MISQEKLEELQSSLESCRVRFSNYQEIPEFVQALMPDNATAQSYQKEQLSLDRPRYDFLKGALDCSGLNVVEVGSNLGFFCLSLAHDLGCRTQGFEPLSDYVKAAGIMAESCGLSESCSFSDKPVSLDDIADLPQADLYIELNVMHHAGAVFDAAQVTAAGGWQAYAVQRLAAYRQKAQHLLFQTGNVADGKALFPTDNAVNYVHDMLTEAGWTVVKLGTISDLQRMDYDIFDIAEKDQATTYRCQRNRETNLVDFFKGDSCVGSLITGLANRPIWFCKKNG